LPEALRHRIIGATWHSKMAEEIDYSHCWNAATRYQQIRRYVNRARLTDWVAIDDDGEMWSTGDADKLVLTDSQKGLSDAKILQQLSIKLRGRGDSVKRFLITLSMNEGELISRSKAKNVVAQLEVHEEVEIDFVAVDQIDQSFADELVRVWPLAHPNTRMKIVNASEKVAKVLKHVMGRTDLPQPINNVKVKNRE